MSEQSNCFEAIAKNASLQQYEEALQQEPYSVSVWYEYLEELETMLPTNSDSMSFVQLREWVGKRACHLLPRSYKLWRLQWTFAVKHYATTNPENVIACFEAALRTQSAYPRIWADYMQFLLDHSDIAHDTFLRRTFNRALQSVAVAQHDKIWNVVLDKWTTAALPVPSVLRILRRYTLLHPEATATTLAQTAAEYGHYGVAASAYVQVLSNIQDEDEQQPYWQALVDLCREHSETLENTVGLDWEGIIRSLLKESAKKKNKNNHTLVSSNSGELWAALAEAWTRRGAFDIARTIYEEGLQECCTVKDFSLLYSAYLQFEEGLLQATMEQMEEEESSDKESQQHEQKLQEDDWDILLHGTTSSRLADMELAMARAEYLTSKRPLLLNAVMLRQNPFHVGEWLNRAELYCNANQPGQAAHSLETSLKSVPANKAVGGAPSQLVISLAKLYEEQLEDVGKARALMERVCRDHDYRFHKVDDLAECWATWIELELRHEAWDDALSLTRESVASGTGGKRLNLTRSLRLWDLRLDLEESLGTVQTTKDAYNRALETQAATVQHVLNFGAFLAEHKYFEESFTAYERGLELFPFPHSGAKVLWKTYLDAFLKRHKGTKLERTRDLFERCLEHCPPEDCAAFYLMNGELEEEYGLTMRALSVYRKMCDHVPQEEKLNAYQLLIAKTTKFKGLTATRDIYQEAVEKLDEPSAARMCIDFATMETKLQQIERARAILTFGAQMANPRTLPEYWKYWNSFEIENGNEETFREMLRVKRSVEAVFSTVNYNAAGMSEKLQTLTDEEAMQLIANSEGVDLEMPSKPKVSGFVPSSKRPLEVANLDDMENRVAKLRKMTGADQKEGGSPHRKDNDDEIDIDDIDAEIVAAAAEGNSTQDITTKDIPSAVFGGLSNQLGASEAAKESN